MADLHPDPALHSTIRAQLEKIRASPELAPARRLQDLLSFVVEETLAGRSERLTGYTLALKVFGRDATFDSSTDSLVRVGVGRLRRRLRTYYLGAGRADPIHIDLPRGSYVPRFRSNGRPAPPGVGPEEPDPTARPEPVIAVLPFDNLSANADDGAFGSGLALELVTELHRRRLPVIAHHATSRYGQRTVDVRDLGRDLGVSHVLDGTVRRAGATVRVTVHLFDARRAFCLWAETYDRELEAGNALQVQDEISQRVVATIARPCGPIYARWAATTGRETRSLTRHRDSR